MVPDVMTTELNRSKTGLIAIAGSRHLEKWLRYRRDRHRDYLRQVENRVGHSRVIRLEWLQYQEEACGRSQRHEAESKWVYLSHRWPPE